MLTQGPSPDPQRQLNISSFLTLSHLLDCLIYTRNSVSIALLLRMMEGWLAGGWLIHIRVWLGGQGGHYLIVFLFFFYLCFCLLISHVLSLFQVSRA